MAVNHVSIYSKGFLSIYDIYVLGISNRLAWRCPTPILLEHYNKHISLNHLDVGVGTGYFLNKCHFPAPGRPTLHLLDLNPNSLEVASRRIQRYQPQTHVADILQPLTIALPKFDSIGMNYLLHCLPGNIQTKDIVFKNLVPLLNPGGVIFGATIIGKNNKPNFFARKLLHLYNSKNIFHNLEDDFEGLKQVLERNTKRYSIRQQGCVAIFEGTV